MKKLRSAFVWIVLAGLLAACSTALNACGGPQTPDATPTPKPGPQVSVQANLDNVFIVRADAARENLLAPQKGVLSINEGVDVDEAGRAILQFADLLTVEVLRAGGLTVQEVSIDDQNAAVTIFQNGGALLNNFDPAAEIAKRFTVNTDFATITATGTQFLVVQEANSPLEWVLALDASPNDLEVTSTATNATKDVQTNAVRWIAPIGDPSANISADMGNVNTWLQQSQAGTNTDNFGDIVWAAADVQADFAQITATGPDVNPAPGVSYTYQGVQMTLGNAGTYTSQDCNMDGISDIAIKGGTIDMDFRTVLARVKALDVTALIESGTGKLTVFDPAHQPIQSQSALAAPQQAQILTTRDTVPYHYAELSLEDGCFLGFSLTPPTPSGQPDVPRAAVQQLEVADNFVRIDTPADGSIVTEPLIISGIASVPEFTDRQLLVKIETPDGQEIQQLWAHITGGEIGGEPGTFSTSLTVDYILPAEIVVRVQNIQPSEFPVVLAEDAVQITLNPEKTGAFRRPPENGEFYAPFISETIGTNSIRIDSDPTDWQNAMKASGVMPTAINNIVYDNGCDMFNPYGIPSFDVNVDLAAQVMFAYDSDYLYVLYLVQDESYAPYMGNDNRLFLGDSPQLIVDTDLAGDFDITTDNKDDIQYDFHPGYADSTGNHDLPLYYLYGPHAVFWNLGDAIAQGLAASRNATEVIMGSWMTLDGYGLEVAIPWGNLNYSGVPGGSFGVAPSVSDNDDPQISAQQCMISGAPFRNYLNPTTYGTLFLIALP